MAVPVGVRSGRGLAIAVAVLGCVPGLAWCLCSWIGLVGLVLYLPDNSVPGLAL